MNACIVLTLVNRRIPVEITSMLTIDIQSAPPAVVLACSGRVVLGMEAEKLRCTLFSRPERYLFLDLRDVHVLDAAGLGLLIELYRWADQRDRVLAIVNPSKRVRTIIAITKLRSVLQLSDTGTDESQRLEVCEDELSEYHAMTA
jgi:anti-anti-sigma factor